MTSRTVRICDELLGKLARTGHPPMQKITRFSPKIVCCLVFGLTKYYRTYVPHSNVITHLTLTPLQPKEKRNEPSQLPLFSQNYD